METLEQLEKIAFLKCECTCEQLSGRDIDACRPCEAVAVLRHIEEFTDAQLKFFFKHHSS